jgi:hypothetical protein
MVDRFIGREGAQLTSFAPCSAGTMQRSGRVPTSPYPPHRAGIVAPGAESDKSNRPGITTSSYGRV